MKITFESQLWYRDKNCIEIDIYFDDGNNRVLHSKEILFKEHLQDSFKTMHRIIDKLFYELKNKVKEEYYSFDFQKKGQLTNEKRD